MEAFAGWPSAGTFVADRYRIESKLGAGGMGTVWLAHDLSLDRQCAIKIIDPDKAQSEEVRTRFQREAKAAAQLRCDNVVEIFDHGEYRGLPFIVMELLEGEDLFTRLFQKTRLGAEETYRIVVQVARALARAHAAGIVHRDIKPENIFLVPGDEQETAKVLDFGIAKHQGYELHDRKTKDGTLLGTPYYMSPEQIRGEPVDWRADLWSLAVIAFQCLTGRPPFDSDALGQLMGAILYERIPRPTELEPKLGPALDAWWEKASDRDREQRYQTAKELSDALGEALGSVRLPVPSMLPRSRSESEPGVDRIKLVFGAACAGRDVRRADARRPVRSRGATIRSLPRHRASHRLASVSHAAVGLAAGGSDQATVSGLGPGSGCAGRARSHRGAPLAIAAHNRHRRATEQPIECRGYGNSASHSRLNWHGGRDPIRYPARVVSGRQTDSARTTIQLGGPILSVEAASALGSEENLRSGLRNLA